ncbi:hypothetical protein DFH06DRAFT_694969 [Mycena polygramma]|nr:hypothetical protein DFH06DRAFT_694969 [Mycena polygramma]
MSTVASQAGRHGSLLDSYKLVSGLSDAADVASLSLYALPDVAPSPIRLGRDSDVGQPRRGWEQYRFLKLKRHFVLLLSGKRVPGPGTRDLRRWWDLLQTQYPTEAAPTCDLSSRCFGEQTRKFPLLLPHNHAVNVMKRGAPLHHFPADDRDMGPSRAIAPVHDSARNNNPYSVSRDRGECVSAPMSVDVRGEGITSMSIPHSGEATGLQSHGRDYRGRLQQSLQCSIDRPPDAYKRQRRRTTLSIHHRPPSHTRTRARQRTQARAISSAGSDLPVCRRWGRPLRSLRDAGD